MRKRYLSTYNQQRNQSFVATLLVPSILIKKLKRKSKHYNNLRGYFHFLAVNKFKNKYSNKARLRTKYQDNGDLVKINFRPYAEDWELFRLYANSLRVSIIFLFVWLLKESEEEGGGNSGVPTKKITLLLNQKLTITPVNIYLRTLRILL